MNPTYLKQHIQCTISFKERAYERCKKIQTIHVTRPHEHILEHPCKYSFEATNYSQLPQKMMIIGNEFRRE